MPAVNSMGASKKKIDAAIELIERVGGPSRVFKHLATGRELGRLRQEEALALEMAAHEAQERRLLMGEVGALGLELSEAQERAHVVERL